MTLGQVSLLVLSVSPANHHSTFVSYSPNIIRMMKSSRMRWAGHVARTSENMNPYMIFVGKPEGRRPLGRPRRRWEDNIKVDLREVGRGIINWTDLA
jgi:hypothetical protein